MTDVTAGNAGRAWYQHLRTQELGLALLVAGSRRAIVEVRGDRNLLI
ncbi:MAG: hypothetical protein RIE24_13730 [Silicimonas sp.]